MALDRQPKDADELFDIARATGLDVAKIRARLLDKEDPAYSRLDRDMQSVHLLGITQTPTFLTIYGGKVQETISGGQILTSLDSPKYQKVMNGGRA
jgi:predicted DsbA family dithiol-disulfide isomerase